jgi:hypothetical protein
MKERLSVGWVRIFLAVIVLAGSIVTFNFGLVEGQDTADFLWQRSWWCEMQCGYHAKVQLDKMIGDGEWLALLLLFVGALIFWQNNSGREIEGRGRKNIDAELLYPWAMPSPRWISTVPAKQLNLSSARMRPHKRIRLLR